MPFKPGVPRPPGSGRKAGVPNKTTATIKEAIEQAFDELGGAEYLKQIAKIDPKAFCALLGKVLPKDVSISGGAGEPVKIIVVTGVPKKGDQVADAGS